MTRIVNFFSTYSKQIKKSIWSAIVLIILMKCILSPEVNIFFKIWIGGVVFLNYCWNQKDF